MNVISQFVTNHRLPESFNFIANKHYIPLANEIISHRIGASMTYYVGINGCQGSGKSTLSEFLKVYIESQTSLSVEVMSLDDFYYSHDKRTELADQIHPLLQTRGVPGTHDTELAKAVLHAISNGSYPITIPRFNKSTDNPYPQEQWPQLESKVDIVIFEGWCWGVSPQSSDALVQPINQLEKQQDPDGKWRQYVNHQLTVNYQPLYEFMEMWVMFKAPSFNDVYAWRLEQEQKLLASLDKDSDKSGVMDEQQIMDFIQYYQRLTEHGLSTLPERCQHVFELDSKRQITKHTSKEKHG